MDLGISGRLAIVCASSKGLGLGCAEELAANGVNLIMNARTADVLNASASRLADTYGVTVTPVATDITTEAGRAEVLDAAAGQTVDILVNNAGGPPPGDFRDWERDDWIGAVDANMLTPIELIKAVIDPMIDQRFGRIVNITSGSVRNPIPQLGMSNGARAGLTGFVAGLARQVAAHNVTINNLLPGQFDTDRIASLFASRAAKEGRDAADLGLRLKRQIRAAVSAISKSSVMLAHFCVQPMLVMWWGRTCLLMAGSLIPVSDPRPDAMINTEVLAGRLLNSG